MTPILLTLAQFFACTATDVDPQVAPPGTEVMPPGTEVMPPGTVPPPTEDQVVPVREAPAAGVSLEAAEQGVTISAGYNDHVVDFELSSWGRNGTPVAMLAPVTADSPLDPNIERVSYAHGPFTDWYETRAEGIKHGIDVLSRPEGVGELRFSYQLASDMLPVFNEAHGAVFFVSAETGQTALTYDGLVTLDETGTMLPSWIEFDCEAAECSLSLVVDDTEATYPIQIDPVFVSNLTTLPLGPSTSNEQFGIAVDIFGDIAVVGSPNADDNGGNRGVADIYRRTGTTWAHEQTLTPGVTNGDRCGRAVAAGADRVIVGCWQGDAPDVNSGFGSVYFFNGTTWVLEGTLTDPNPVANQRLGYSADINAAGDRVIMGGWDNSIPGRVVIYERSGTTWTANTTFNGIINADSGQSARLGNSTGITDDRAIAGAPRFDVDTNGTARRDGAAYFYRRVPNPMGPPAFIWVLDQTETPYSGANFNFGFSVDLDATTAVVGELRGTGLATVYNEGAPGVWSVDTTLVNGQVGGDRFGFSVAINADRIAVGAPRDETSGVTDGGSAHIFDRVNGLWVPSLEFSHTTADGATVSGEFGQSVGVAGDYAIVGSNSNTPNPDEAFILQLDVCGPVETQTGCDVDLIVTEFHPNPQNAVDGQFIEIHNRGTSGVDLEGLTIDTDSMAPIVISGPLRVLAGGYAVIAASGDPSFNGNLPTDNLYVDSNLVLDATADTITLTGSDAALLHTVTYSDFDSVGASLQLHFDGIDYADFTVGYAGPKDTGAGTDPGSFCETYTAFEDGDDLVINDFMTPGTVGDSCGLDLMVEFEYQDVFGGTLSDGATSFTLSAGGTFTTGNSGVGEFQRTTSVLGQTLEMTYDTTGVVYRSFIRPYGQDCFIGRDMDPLTLPSLVNSGEWTNVDCDP